MTICPTCDEVFDPDDVDVISGEEVFDLIAHAALVSPHARRAYELLREMNPGILPLDRRQILIGDRMKELPL